MNRPFAFGFVVLCCVSYAAALKCYECNSSVIGNCLDPTNVTMLAQIPQVECDTRPQTGLPGPLGAGVTCYKETSKNEFGERVKRGCAQLLGVGCDYSNDALTRCVCTGELCNAAGTGPSPIHFAGAVVAAISAVFFGLM